MAVAGEVADQGEQKVARYTMAPLAAFAGFVALGYAAQMWLVKKQGYGAVDAAKVQRLRYGDEE